MPLCQFIHKMTKMTKKTSIKIDSLRLAVLAVSLLTLIGLDQLRNLSCPAEADFLSLGEPVEEQEKPKQPWDAEPLPEELRLNYTPSLLDRTQPLVLLRQNIPLSSYYKFPHRQFSGECSCQNPKATLECCSRTFRRSHKMGCVMSMNLLKQYPNSHRLAAEPKWFTYNLGLPETDYRDVIVLRDIYASILSGYLYHHKGFECNMPDKVEDYLGEWDEHVGFQLRPPRQGRTICKYIAKTKPATGMRTYIDWVMHYYYAPIFAHWAMGNEIPEMKERTKTICYEDLMSKDRDLEAVNTMVDFFFNGTAPEPWEGTPPGHTRVESGYKGGHSTTNDRSAKEKEGLIQMIKNLDKNVYNGEIAWLNSINPCGGKKK